MKICGLQKLSLLDYPQKLAATVFLGGCNFRCPFCHNSSLVLTPDACPSISEDEFYAFLDRRKGLLDGVCVTGGEPLISDEVFGLISGIRERGFSVKLDTNGSFPDRLRRLLDKGLVDYAAMDIKNSPAKYAETAGLPTLDLSAVEESANLLMTSGVPYEFRTTIVSELHTRQDIEEIGRWLNGAERYYLQHFVDSGELIGSGFHAVSKEDTAELVEAARPYFKLVEARGL